MGFLSIAFLLEWKKFEKKTSGELELFSKIGISSDIMFQICMSNSMGFLSLAFLLEVKKFEKKNSSGELELISKIGISSNIMFQICMCNIMTTLVYQSEAHLA